jgi:flagellar hook-associated protein 3 FlgL
MAISTGNFYKTTTDQMNTVQSSLSKIESQLSSGKQNTQASDDPNKASLILGINSEIARQTSYQDTITSVSSRLQTEDSALQNVNTLLSQFNQLAIQAATSTVSLNDRGTIANQMSQLKAQILSGTNTQDGTGAFVFAGSNSNQPAYAQDAQGNVTYQGDQNSMQVSVGDSLKININTPGTNAFVNVPRSDGKGGQVGVSFFQSLNDTISAVKNSDMPNIQRGIGELTNLTQGVNNALANVGSNESLATNQSSVLSEVTLRLNKTLSDVQDLNYTQAITNMNRDQLALQAAQSAFAQMTKNSLFNYING